MPEPSQVVLTIGEALRRGAALLSESDTPQLDARILLKYVLKADDGALIARANAALSDAEREHYLAVLARRAAAEPVAYITGEKEFWSLPFRVTRDVLIPRGDSECLIEAAVARRGRDEKLRILDLGTGSGCLLCALLSEFPASTGLGVDRSAAALAVAAHNATALGLGARAAFLESDWTQSVAGRFDIVIANPPYIPAGASLPRSVAGYEPHSALFACADGLDDCRAIVENLGDALADDGLLIMECGDHQADALKALLSDFGRPNEAFTLYDLAGRPRGAALDLRNAEKNC
ncbi:MAG: peptide chain release factor N(5)-glutamine methyltransferase [Parvularculaceae bacterium]